MLHHPISIYRDVATAIAWILMACPAALSATERLRELEDSATLLGAAEGLTGRQGADIILRMVARMLAERTASLEN